MIQQECYLIPEIINYITKNTSDNTEIIFLGTKTERRHLNPLFFELDSPERCVNLAGKLGISLIPIILKSCEFLISVESGNVHIAHEVGCKTICLSGSTAYGRFHPYKDNIVKYIYPEKFKELIKKFPEKLNIIGYLPPPDLFFSVNDINIENVKEEIGKLIYNKT